MDLRNEIFPEIHNDNLLMMDKYEHGIVRKYYSPNPDMTYEGIVFNTVLEHCSVIRVCSESIFCKAKNDNAINKGKRLARRYPIKILGGNLTSTFYIEVSLTIPSGQEIKLSVHVV